MSTDELNKENQSNDDDDRKFTNEHHPDAEISEENKIIEGDKVMDGGKQPEPAKRKPNYLLMILVIVVVIVAIIWAVRGCNRSSEDGYVFNFINQTLWYC